MEPAVNKFFLHNVNVPAPKEGKKKPKPNNLTIGNLLSGSNVKIKQM